MHECLNLFSEKNKKSILKCRLLKFLPSMPSVNLHGLVSYLLAFIMLYIMYAGCQ